MGRRYLDLVGAGAPGNSRIVDKMPLNFRHAGLIAMETHGRRGLSRMIVGSVADKIVRGAEVPVLLHRPRR